MLDLIWGSSCIKFCKLTCSYFLEKWKNRIKETDYKHGSNKRIVCGAADIWSSESHQCFLKVYYEIHCKLMILLGGEFGCHCNAKGSEEECFCTHLSWFGTHDPCLLLSTSYETCSFFPSKSCTSPSRNCSSSLRKFLQGYFVWKKMEVFSGVKWWKILYLKAYIQWAAVELFRNCERELEARRVVIINKMEAQL